MMRSGVWVVFLMMPLAGCGGGGEPADSGVGTGDGGGGVGIVECDQPFSACGGDVTGSWDVVAVCDPALDTAALGCPGVTYDITADRSGGTVDFQAGGTYDRNYDIDVDYEMLVPKSCLGGLGCSTLVAFSGGLVTDCVDEGENCDCTGTFATVDASTGTWEMDGDTVVTDGSDRTDVCVKGNSADSEDEDGVRVAWKR